MNIAFFLLPKESVLCLSPQSTMRQALERMEFHRYSAVPLVDANGKYEGTLTEGDLLWKMKNMPGLSFEDTNKISLQEVPRRTKNAMIRIDAEIEDLISLSTTQNFVPVIDDHDIFIGIIRRSDIIEYCKNQIYKKAHS
jgi:CBS-domain-containing membrane protein